MLIRPDKSDSPVSKSQMEVIYTHKATANCTALHSRQINYSHLTQSTQQKTRIIDFTVLGLNSK